MLVQLCVLLFAAEVCGATGQHYEGSSHDAWNPGNAHDSLLLGSEAAAEETEKAQWPFTEGHPRSYEGHTRANETHQRERRSTHTVTTSTKTTSTSSHTTSTITTTTTTTSTSTTGPHVFGGSATKKAFEAWLAVFRSKYTTGLWNIGLADPWDSLMPLDLQGLTPMLVESEGGVATGVVSEGMGYGIMVEGFLAAAGNVTALEAGLSLTKSWLAMVNGPGNGPRPFAGGGALNHSATRVGDWPYGASAVEWSSEPLGPAGVPAWKFPINHSHLNDYMGSAADGDQDALLGMIYLAGTLGYPADFVDMVMRTLIAFVSADLGFPDLYRTLPGGESIFVPKMGSQWGGLLPPGGSFQTAQQPWCYSPGYFAPAHYRTFRDFVKRRWDVSFAAYLPPHLDGLRSTVGDLLHALESAIVAGYNILYYSSCSSGAVSNWVGVKAECVTNDTLNCPGVPWAYTPYVGPERGHCNASNTRWGAYGADASRTAWRIAMDYALFRNESARIPMYDRDGWRDLGLFFGAQDYLNRFVVQYSTHALCDGGEPGDCMTWEKPSPWKIAAAFDPNSRHPNPPDNLSCNAVPNHPESWWAGFMSYPTFSTFIAPYDNIGAAKMSNWMDTFVSICNFSGLNFTDFTSGEKPKGKICLTSYFEASQAVISTLIMADRLVPVPQKRPMTVLSNMELSQSVGLDARADGRERRTFAGYNGAPEFVLLLGAIASVPLAASVVMKTRRRNSLRRTKYFPILGAAATRTLSTDMLVDHDA